MVSRVQARVVQQGLPERRVTARSARPSTLALLGKPLSSAEAHRFLLVGGGHQYVMTLITRIGITSRYTSDLLQKCRFFRVDYTPTSLTSILSIWGEASCPLWGGSANNTPSLSLLRNISPPKPAKIIPPPLSPSRDPPGRPRGRRCLRQPPYLAGPKHPLQPLLGKQAPHPG